MNQQISFYDEILKNDELVKDAAIELLKFILPGKENARKSDVLAKMINLKSTGSNPRVRALIDNLIRTEKACIGSCKQGYYLIIRPDEINEVCDELRARSQAMKTRITHLQNIFITNN